MYSKQSGRTGKIADGVKGRDSESPALGLKTFDRDKTPVKEKRRVSKKDFDDVKLGVSEKNCDNVKLRVSQNPFDNVKLCEFDNVTEAVKNAD
jgi:hypothetical protein